MTSLDKGPFLAVLAVHVAAFGLFSLAALTSAWTPREAAVFYGRAFERAVILALILLLIALL